MASDEHRRLVQILALRRKDHFDLTAFREDFERFARVVGALPAVTVTAGRVAGVPCEALTPQGLPVTSTLIYVHGGGFVSGSLRTHRELMARLACAAGVRVLGIGYRLAPEHPFPAALDDVVAVVSQYGREADLPWALAGDSAGGCLALAAAVDLCCRGLALPTALYLLSPWSDLSLSGASVKDRAGLDKILQPALLRDTAALYLGSTSPGDPRVSPLFADLQGLPPMMVQVGTREILLDDARRLVLAVNSIGGSAQLRVWDDMVHVWPLYASLIPEGQAALEEGAAFLASYLD